MSPRQSRARCCWRGMTKMRGKPALDAVNLTNDMVKPRLAFTHRGGGDDGWRLPTDDVPMVASFIVSYPTRPVNAARLIAARTAMTGDNLGKLAL